MCSLRVCALCLGYAHFARNSARRLYRGNAETMDGENTGMSGSKISTPVVLPLAISRTMTTLTCGVMAGLWRASGPGAAVGRLCCQPAAPAAGWAQVLGWCRLARPQAALWRFRSRARPRPLIGSCGRGFLGRGRSAVVALHLSPTRSWRRIGHPRCWGEAHAASRLRGRRCRPAGSALARVDPVSGAEEPRRGGSRVTSVVWSRGKEVWIHHIGALCRSTRILW